MIRPGTAREGNRITILDPWLPGGDYTAETLAAPTGLNYAYTDPSGWTLETRDFDYAASPAPLRLCAENACLDLNLELVDGLRSFRTPDGLTAPRTYTGAITILQETLDSLATAPAPLVRAIRLLTDTTPLREITATASLGDLTIHLPTGPLALRRQP
ncbi:hypothetical protein [Nocardia sp. NPDC127526]|uniref:hypothetical protein n=1 Tax=Nocardia sp. NPDC127526 TaxID=3345393 RepID=UPI003629C879